MIEINPELKFHEGIGNDYHFRVISIFRLNLYHF